MCGDEEKWVQSSVQEAQNERGHLENLDVYGTIILNWNS